MTQTIAIPLGRVYANPRNNRTELRRIPELAENIRVNGLIDPIIVVKDGEDAYLIVAGHRRHAAMKLLGAETIDAIVASDMDEADIIQRLVAANAGTDPLTDVELSMGVQQMLLLGLPIETTAASSGETRERVEKASRGYRLYRDFAGDEPEQTTIDRYIALSDFEDDEDAAKKLMTSYEKDWPRVYADLKRDRGLKAARVRATALVEAAGCEVKANGEGGVYLGRGEEKPEGATFAVLLGVWESVFINWYGPAELADESARAEAERRAEQDALVSALESEHLRRVSHIVENITTCKELLKLAQSLWEDGRRSADVRYLTDEWRAVSGPTSRVWASVMAAIEREAESVFRDDHYARMHGKAALAYHAALVADGYEPTDDERARFKALKPSKKAKA